VPFSVHGMIHQGPSEKVATLPMVLTRAEIDEMLRRADEVRKKLRRATRELAAFGDQLLKARDRADADRSR
jgi:hypothetical protein